MSPMSVSHSRSKDRAQRWCLSPVDTVTGQTFCFDLCVFLLSYLISCDIQWKQVPPSCDWAALSLSLLSCRGSLSGGGREQDNDRGIQLFVSLRRKRCVKLSVWYRFSGLFVFLCFFKLSFFVRVGSVWGVYSPLEMPGLFAWLCGYFVDLCFLLLVFAQSSYSQNPAGRWLAFWW